VDAESQISQKQQEYVLPQLEVLCDEYLEVLGAQQELASEFIRWKFRKTRMTY